MVKQRAAVSALAKIQYDVMFIDFDRSGIFGEARYPLWAGDQMLRNRIIRQGDEIKVLRAICPRDRAAHRDKRRRVGTGKDTPRAVANEIYEEEEDSHLDERDKYKKDDDDDDDNDDDGEDNGRQQRRRQRR
jgi:hypothetical protein